MNNEDRDKVVADLLFGDQPVAAELGEDQQTELESLQGTLDFLERHRETPPATPEMNAFWQSFEAPAKPRRRPYLYVAAALAASLLAALVLQQQRTLSDTNIVVTLQVEAPVFSTTERFGRKAQMLLLSIANRDLSTASGDATQNKSWQYERRHAAKLAAEADALLQDARLAAADFRLLHMLHTLLLQIANVDPYAAQQLALIQQSLARENLLFKIDLMILRRTLEA